MVARPITRHDRPQESESSDVDIARSILRLCDGGFLNLNRSYAASCLDIVTACGFYQVLTRKLTYFVPLSEIGPCGACCILRPKLIASVVDTIAVNRHANCKDLACTQLQQKTEQCQ